MVAALLALCNSQNVTRFPRESFLPLTYPTPLSIIPKLTSSSAATMAIPQSTTTSKPQPFSPTQGKIPRIKLRLPSRKRPYDGRRDPAGSPGQAIESAFKATNSKRRITGGKHGLGVKVVNNSKAQASVSAVTDKKLKKGSVGFHAVIRIGGGSRRERRAARARRRAVRAEKRAVRAERREVRAVKRAHRRATRAGRRGGRGGRTRLSSGKHSAGKREQK